MYMYICICMTRDTQRSNPDSFSKHATHTKKLGKDDITLPQKHNRSKLGWETKLSITEYTNRSQPHSVCKGATYQCRRQDCKCQLRIHICTYICVTYI